MKKHKNLLEKTAEFENLYNAYLKARRGKNEIKEVASFTYALENELFNLQDELVNGTYKTGKYHNFVLYEPKKRLISALPFRDRIVHHAVCNVISPIFETTFIHDSYACRKNKGTHKGIARLQKFIAKTPSFYCLKCDVSKYFQSVDNAVLKQLLRKKIADKKMLDVLDGIIDSFAEGIPIGNLTSQLFANIFLTDLDNYAKHALKAEYYIRYMDDFIILDSSKKNLHEMKSKIALFLASMNLQLHPKKAVIFPAKQGIDFLGYVVYEHHKKARKSTVKRFIKRVKQKISQYNAHSISFEKLLESFNSWNAYLGHADTFSLKKSIYQNYFKNIM